MLIAHDHDYVDISGVQRVVDLRGKRKVKEAKDLKQKKNEEEDPETEKTEPNLEDQCIGETNNWQEKYWNKDSNENYKKICEAYEKDPEKYALWGKHPRDLSLREFLVYFSKKWKPSYNPKAFLHSIPSFRYPVHKGNNS